MMIIIVSQCSQLQLRKGKNKKLIVISGSIKSCNPLLGMIRNKKESRVKTRDILQPWVAEMQYICRPPIGALLARGDQGRGEGRGLLTWHNSSEGGGGGVKERERGRGLV